MSVGIVINSIKEEEFKFSDKNLESLDSKLLSIGFHLKFKVDVKGSFFSVTLTILYNYGNDDSQIELLKFTTLTKFKVKGLKKLVHFEEGNDEEFQIPDALMITFLGTAISSARGMLTYKLSGTILSDYYLPLIDVEDLLKEYETSPNSDLE